MLWIRKSTVGQQRGLMAALRNIFRQAGDVTSVPEMLASYGAVKRKLPELRRNAGGKSLFEAAVFQDITVAALVEFQELLGRRTGGRDSQGSAGTLTSPRKHFYEAAASQPNG
jgi:hypothetical protein